MTLTQVRKIKENEPFSRYLKSNNEQITVWYRFSINVRINY